MGSRVRVPPRSPYNNSVFSVILDFIFPEDRDWEDYGKIDSPSTGALHPAAMKSQSRADIAVIREKTSKKGTVPSCAADFHCLLHRISRRRLTMRLHEA